MNITFSWKEIDSKKKTRKGERTFRDVNVVTGDDILIWAEKQAKLLGLDAYTISTSTEEEQVGD